MLGCCGLRAAFHQWHNAVRRQTVRPLTAVSLQQSAANCRVGSKAVQCTAGISDGLYWPLPTCRAGSIEWFAEEAKRIYGDIIPVRDLPG